MVTRRELIEEMDVSGGIDWNKMMPPEDERWEEEYELLKGGIRK